MAVIVNRENKKLLRLLKIYNYHQFNLLYQQMMTSDTDYIVTGYQVSSLGIAENPFQ